jgi:hypothetical protein
MKALAGEVADRYPRVDDLLRDVLEAGRDVVRRPAPEPSVAARAPAQPAAVRVITPRPRGREGAASRFCWNCRKPLPARADRCPFCNEAQ